MSFNVAIKGVFNMPISDKVIEMGEVKKSKSVIFIVLISILAAVSVTFAVLWALKKTPTAPPKVEDVIISGTSELFSEPCDSSAQYSVSAGQAYTVYIDVKVPEGTTPDKLNTLLDVINTYPEFITPIDTECGFLDAEHPTRYKYTFTVGTKAEEGKVVSLTFRSSLSEEIQDTIKFVVHREAIHDVVLGELKGSSSGTVLGNFNVPTDDSKETIDGHDVYVVSNPLPGFLYGQASASNEEYVFSIAQLGRPEGESSATAKVSSGVYVEDKHGYYDQIDVFVGTKDAQTNTVTFNPVNANEGFDQTHKGLTVSRIESDIRYYRSGLGIKPNINNAYAGDVYIKLEFNNYSGGEQIIRILKITVADIENINKITEIGYVDANGKPTNEINLFAGDEILVGTDGFNLSKNIRARYAGKYYYLAKRNDDDEALPVGIRAYISDDQGERADSSYVTLTTRGNNLTLHVSQSMKVCTVYVCVTDTSNSYNLQARLVLTVNINAPIVDVTAQKDNEFTNNVVEKTVTSGSKYEFDLTYKFNRKYTDEKNSQFTMENVHGDIFYSYGGTVDGSDQPPEQLNFDAKTGKLTNEDNVIVLANSRQTSLRTTPYMISPDGFSYGPTDSYRGKITVNIGKNVKSGTYVLNLLVAEQSALGGGETFAIKLTFIVSEVAKIVELKSKDQLKELFSTYEDKPEYYASVTSWEEKPNESDGKFSDYKLQLTVPSKGDGDYTEFTVYDLVNYYMDVDKGAEDIVLESSKPYNNDLFKISTSSNYVNNAGKFDAHVGTGDSYSFEVVYEFSVTKQKITFNVTVRRMVSEIALNDKGVSREILYKNISDVNVLTTNYETLSYTDFEGKQITSNVTYYVDIRINGCDRGLDVRNDSTGYIYSYNGTSLFKYSSTRLTILTDLFDYTVKAKNDEDETNDFDFGRITLTYYVHQDHFDTTSQNNDIAVSVGYNFCRKYDSIKVFKTGAYEEEYDKNATDSNKYATRTVSLGSKNIQIYYAGVIGETVIVPNFDLAYCVKHDAISIVGNEYIIWNSQDFSFSTSDKVTDPSTDGAGIVTLSYQTECATNVYFNVSNDVRKITDFYFLDDDSNKSNETEMSVTLYNHKNSVKDQTYVEIPLRIEYETKDEKFTVIEEYSVDKDANKPDALVLDFINPKKPDITSIEPHDDVLKITTANSTQYNSGEYTLIILLRSSQKSEAWLTINVTIITPPDVMQVDGVGDDGAGNFTDSIDWSYQGVELTKTYNLSFINETGVTVDVSRITYAFDKEIDGITHVYSNGKLTVTLSNPKTINNESFKLTFTSFSGTPYAKTFSITVNVNVTISVYSLEIAVSGKTETELNVVTTGNSGTQEFSLSAIYNKGEVQPTTSHEVTFSLYKVGDDSTYLQLEDGKISISGTKLIIDEELLKIQGEYYLVISLSGNDVSERIPLRLTTSKLIISFNELSLRDTSSESRYIQYNNDSVNFGATVINAGTLAVVEGLINYEVIESNGVQVTAGEGGTFVASGSDGTYAIKASYSHEQYSNVYTTIAYVQVKLPADEVKLTHDRFELIQDDNALDLSEYVQIVSKYSGVNPYSQDYTVECLTEGYDEFVTLDSNEGVYTIAPIKQTTSTLTFKVTATASSETESASATFTVDVYVPSVGASATSDVLDLFGGSIEVTVAETNNSSYFSYTINPTILCGDLEVSADAFTIQRDVHKFTITANPQYMTAEYLDKTFNVQISAQITNTFTGAKTFEKTANVTFTLNANYAVQFKLQQLGYENEKEDIVQNSYVDTRKETFITVENLPQVGETVSYHVVTSDGTEFDTDVISATTLGVGEMSVDVTVTILGKPFKSNVQKYIVYDANYAQAIKSQLYVANELTFDDSGNITTTAYNGSAVNVDYDDLSNAKKLFAVIDYTNVLMPEKASVQNFNFNATATEMLEPVKDGYLVNKNGKYYFVSEYYIVKLGEYKFDDATAVINSVSYAVTSAGTLKTTATELEFASTVSGNVSGGNGAYSVDPGAEITVGVVKRGNGKGKFDYTIDEIYGDNNLITGDSDASVNASRELKVRTNITGGQIVLQYKVTVTSGVYKDRQFTFTDTITVSSHVLPVFTVSEMPILDGSQQFELDDLFSYDEDDADYNFAYSVSYVQSGDVGVLENNVYTAPAKKATAQVEQLAYTIQVTGGFFSGYTLRGTIYAYTAPEPTLSASNSVSAGSSINLQYSFNDDTIITDYTVSFDVDENCGTVTQNGKTPTFNSSLNFGGSANIRATFTVNSGVFKGKTYSASTSVQVNKINLLEGGNVLTLSPNASYEIGDLLDQTYTSIVATFDETRYFSSHDNDSVSVKPDANFSDSEIYASTVKISAKQGTANYYGEFEVYVTTRPLPKPTVTAVVKDNNNNETRYTGDTETFSVANGYSITFTAAYADEAGAKPKILSISTTQASLGEISYSNGGGTYRHTNNSTGTTFTLTVTAYIYGMEYTASNWTYTLTTVSANAMTATIDALSSSEVVAGSTIVYELTAPTGSRYNFKRITINSSNPTCIDSCKVYNNSSLTSPIFEGFTIGQRDISATQKLYIQFLVKNTITSRQEINPLNFTLYYSYEESGFMGWGGGTRYASLGTFDIKFTVLPTPTVSDLDVTYPASVRDTKATISTKLATGSNSTVISNIKYNSLTSGFTVSSAGVVNCSTALSVVTKASVTVSADVSGFTVSKDVDIYFVPTSIGITLDGSPATSLRVNKGYQLAMANATGLSEITFSGAYVSGTTFNAKGSGSFVITASYKVASITYTEDLTVTVQPAPVLKVELSGNSYVVSTENYSLSESDISFENLSAELVSVQKSGRNITLTNKSVKVGGTATVKVTVSVSTGVYSGEKLTYVISHEVPSAPAPNPSVNLNTTITNYTSISTISITDNSSSATTYDLSYIGNGILSNQDGAYKLSLKQTNSAQTLSGTLYLTVNDASHPYYGVTFEREVNVTVTAVAEPSPTVTVSGKTVYEDGTFKYRITYSVSVSLDESQYSTVYYGAISGFANGYTTNLTASAQQLSGVLITTITDVNHPNYQKSYVYDFNLTAPKLPDIDVTINSVTYNTDSESYTVNVNTPSSPATMYINEVLATNPYEFITKSTSLSVRVVLDETYDNAEISSTLTFAEYSLLFNSYSQHETADDVTFTASVSGGSASSTFAGVDVDVSGDTLTLTVARGDSDQSGTITYVTTYDGYDYTVKWQVEVPAIVVEPEEDIE